MGSTLKASERVSKVFDTPAAQQDVRRACARRRRSAGCGVPYFVVSKAGKTRALASPALLMRRSSSRYSARSSEVGLSGFERP